jgi:streptogramin lyase
MLMKHVRHLLILAGCSFAFASCTLTAAETVVKTIAGSGQDGYSGDGGPATAAAVSQPFGIVIGPDKALYVCEVGSHAIRRVDTTTGIITTVAGCGRKGYSGNGGSATQAELNEPYEVRFDADGNMYFVEMQNHIVRKVDAKTGIISLVAGNGTQGFSGDDGPAVDAQLSRPHSIALDNAGQLYICDIGNHRVRKVDLKSGIISTFAGTGERKPTADGSPISGTPLNGPRALDFDGKHNLILALREGNAIYRMDLNSQTLHHLAGTGKQGYTGDGGPAIKARLSGPKGVSLAANGDIYFADTESHTVRVVRSDSGIVETLVGNGEKGDGPNGNPLHCTMDRPHGVFVDHAGQVYIGDSNNHQVRIVTPAK